MADRSQAVIIMALRKNKTQADSDVQVDAPAIVKACLRLHDDLFARGLQHHVLGPVVPALVGLGLVHDLLEHGPLPVPRQRGAFKAEQLDCGIRK